MAAPKGNKFAKGNKGGGRPKKANEDRIRGFAIGAIKEVFGSEEGGWKYIAEKAKDSYPHLNLLYSYAYGKPKETKDINLTSEQPVFNLG